MTMFSKTTILNTLERLNIWQIIRYGIVGICAASTHALTAMGARHFLHIDPTLSNFSGFVAGAFISYFGSYYFTFADTKTKARTHGNTILRFLAVWVIGIGINVGLFKWALDCFTLPFWLAVLLAIVITPIAQYVMLRFWAFKK